MNWKDLPLSPSKTQLRQFAAVACFLAMGFSYRYHTLGNEDVSIALGAIGLFSFLSCFLTILVKPIFIVACVVTFPIGWIVFRLLMLAFFIGVFVPIGLTFRIVGRDELKLKVSEKGSHWLSRSTMRDPKRYFRQY